MRFVVYSYSSQVDRPHTWSKPPRVRTRTNRQTARKKTQSWWCDDAVVQGLSNAEPGHSPQLPGGPEAVPQKAACWRYRVVNVIVRDRIAAASGLHVLHAILVIQHHYHHISSNDNSIKCNRASGENHVGITFRFPFFKSIFVLKNLSLCDNLLSILSLQSKTNNENNNDYEGKCWRYCYGTVGHGCQLW